MNTDKEETMNNISQQLREKEYLIALAGNPNVGKSTVFNALTGLRQHTGNWAGKTVTNASGRYEHNGTGYILTDLPGTYSLFAHSAEEKAARDFLCFSEPDAVIVVCDATCLERNLNLLLQTMEITPKTVLCINLLDEAKKKGISVDEKKLSEILGIPVVGVTARDGKGLDALMNAVEETIKSPPESAFIPSYSRALEEEITRLANRLAPITGGRISPRWTALRLIDRNEELVASLNEYLETDVEEEIFGTLNLCREALARKSYNPQSISDEIISGIINTAEKISEETVSHGNPEYYERDRRIDRILTSRIFGIPIMLGILGLIFWITIVGANYPSQLLSDLLFSLGDKLSGFLENVGCHEKVISLAIDGVYRTLAWVVSVMLPPMAIFFPLFTLLEDVGYLPRAAFNLDRHFRRANACGKQALTMCMGFGCNAAGVTGCRIIDSPRERLIAILTNCLVPCNGRFPSLISIITIFFAASMTGIGKTLTSALVLLGVIIAGVSATLLISWLLSVTILKGVPSAFTLELPPYRRPQIGKVIVRSVFDRTIFVLARACAVAAPAGLVIWLLANLTVGGGTILSHISGFLEAPGRFLGMDGEILLAFILGFPANEIVVPIILMCYTSSGMLPETESTQALGELLTANGWTTVTAVCVLIFILFHFPCSTTCLTIRKETGSFKWTAAAILLPTLFGALLCAVISGISRIFV